MAGTEQVAPKDMDRWLGDGGMPIIGVVGGAFTAYGVDGEDLGWAGGTFSPTELACNPHGITQAGVHSLLLDAAMNFAINAALPRKARTRGTLEMKTECMRPARWATPLYCGARSSAWPNRWPTARRRCGRPTGRSSAGPRGPFSCIDPSPNLPPDPYRVPEPGPGVCLICCGPAAVSAVCFACRLVGHRLGLPLTPVTPVRLCPLPGPLYTVLMGYKESPVPEARARFTPMVRRLFDAFFEAHAAGLATGAPVDLVLAVPSTARPSGPPLARVAGLADVVGNRLGACWRDDLLARGAGMLGHMRPRRDGFVVPPSGRSDVRGRHLLLLDDTYVSGARAQSAAAALRLAGAASVRIVVAGRVLRPDRVPGHADFILRQIPAPAPVSAPAPASGVPDDRRCPCAQTRAPSG